MLFRRPPRWTWLLAAVAVGLAGSAALLRAEWGRQREAFDTDARIAHRLLSQRAVQLDAILATLTLLQAAPSASGREPPEQRLPALYPQVLQVLRRGGADGWPPALAQAEALSASTQRAALAEADLPRGRYTLVRAGVPGSYALRIDAAEMVPWDEWPLPRNSSVRVLLQHAGQTFVLQPGAVNPHLTPPSLHDGWHFSATKALASPSQPFQLVLNRTLPWSAAPWGQVALWWAAVLAVAAALLTAQRQRVARRRAEELLRLGQVGRLNAMGELAAGMAHELNQPLTAVLASTQAAQRLLAEGSDELPTVQRALAHSVQQARRASDVVARLRRLMQPPDTDAPLQPLPLAETARSVLHLLAPEAERLGVQPELRAAAGLPRVMAEPVALEQIVHNLVQNALQALSQVPAAQRRLTLRVEAQQAHTVSLVVHDTGPGFTPESLARAFEPFYTTRGHAPAGAGTVGGLGLGLSLCETLAANLGGVLSARNHPDGGAELSLALPAAAAHDAPHDDPPRASERPE